MAAADRGHIEPGRSLKIPFSFLQMAFPIALICCFYTVIAAARGWSKLTTPVPGGKSITAIIFDSERLSTIPKFRS